jgi:RES domain-containing protein
MFIETNQDRASGLFHPLTFCSYSVDCEDILDLTASETRKALNITMTDLSCPWLIMSVKGLEPPSWSIARRLRDQEGAAGILVPSFAPGATEADVNLVLWNYGPERPHLVEVYDPERRLPKNQRSFAET